jgi:flagellar motor switch/type III secretory pathway protein FliN
MTNANQLPQETAELIPEPEVEEAARQEALVPCPKTVSQEPLSLSLPLGRLPVELDVAVPVRAFRVRNLVDLQVGQVVESQWEHTEDLPLAAGDVQLAWSEFEVLDSQLGVRITRLA